MTDVGEVVEEEDGAEAGTGAAAEEAGTGVEGGKEDGEDVV